MIQLLHLTRSLCRGFFQNNINCISKKLKKTQFFHCFSNKQQPPQQARSRSATISGRFLTTTLPKRLSKPSHLHATDAVIFQLKPIKEGYLIHKRKKRWIILDDANLYIFKGTEVVNSQKISLLHKTIFLFFSFFFFFGNWNQKGL